MRVLGSVTDIKGPITGILGHGDIYPDPLRSWCAQKGTQVCCTQGSKLVACHKDYWQLWLRFRAWDGAAYCSLPVGEKSYLQSLENKQDNPGYV